MTCLTITAPTTELLASIKAECAALGAIVRLRKLSGSLRGWVRLVIVSGTRDQVRDALVLLDARCAGGRSLTDPQSRFAWNGDQINVCFPK